jgi:hypothetical protein
MLSAPVQWFLLSSVDSVLFYVAANPGCTTNEIAEDMALIPREASGIVADLCREGMLYVSSGRGHRRYTVNLDSHFMDRTLEGHTLRYVLGQMAMQGQLLMAAAS